MKYLAVLAGACMALHAGAALAAAPVESTAAAYKPSVDDWVGVNAAVDNYTLGLELHDMARFDKAFWPEATIVAQPEPGLSFTMPYRKAAEGPPKPPAGGFPPPGAPPPGGLPPGGLPPGGPPPGGPPPGGPPPGIAMPAGNAIGNGLTPWHLSLSHHFEFQSATRATHYGYFVSVYPDLKTKMTIVGLPGHYDDVLEKRNGEWRILQRKTVIGAK
jgi:hypothetical protein